MNLNFVVMVLDVESGFNQIKHGYVDYMFDCYH